jgi:hypothetical protein
MKKLKLFFMQKQKAKAQSLMEMSIVVLVLMMLALGMVEFGNLMNQYITLVDGTREGARFASNNDPYAIENAKTGEITYDYSKVQSKFYENTDQVIDGGKDGNAEGNFGAIAPLTLNGTTDEVMIYFLSIRSGLTYIVSDGGDVWCKFGCGVHKKEKAIINANPEFIRKSLSPDAPNTGIVVVEVFFAYHQLLNLPLFTAMFPGGTIPVHAYSIMPLSAAEPTPNIPTPTSN